MSASICLDAEFTDHTEMLELSVYDTATSVEIYHSYFRPELEHRWPISQRIHHITPAMVRNEKPFRKRKAEIQAVVDRARDIVGFAIGNDITALSNQGIEGLDDKRIIDVRDIFWFVHGRHNGGDLNNAPGLLAVAHELGIDFSDSEAHSAGADTKATVDCYNALIARHAATGTVPAGTDPLEDLLAQCDRAKAEYHRQQAAGFVGLLRAQGKTYKLKFLKSHAPEGPNVEHVIHVADRSIAQYDLLKRFARHLVPGRFDIYALTAADIEYFKAYTNEHDPEKSALCKKLVSGRGKFIF